jgi:uncharacterized phage protein (TIGR02220 family)
VKNNGYILLHRDLMDNWVWQDEVFTKGQAWVDLLMLINHSDNDKVLINNKFISVKRGETITSKVKLAARWQWSRKKLDKFLKLLEGDKMVTTNSTPHYTTIKVLNYAQYQQNKKVFAQPNAQPKDHELHNSGSNGGTQTSNDISNVLNNDKQKDTVPYKKIIQYLNDKCGTQYKSTTKKTQKLIKARYNEGFTLEDFKQAIDNAYNFWSNKNDLTRMNPKTLFNGEFEGRVTNDSYGWDKPKDKKEPTAGGAEWMGI